MTKKEKLTAKEVSDKYTVAELKYILKENGLKVSGKKQDLVERVLPILNEDSSEKSIENVPNDSESIEKATFNDKEVSSAQTEDLPSPENNELLSPALSMFGIDYEELPIEDKTIIGDNTTLKINGFTQNGVSMSDFTMSLVGASDSSNVDLKMNIPEVSCTDFENTIFTFKDLDLSMLPSSSPQSLEFSAILDSLEIITESYYVNLKGLNLLFKSYPDNGVRIDIDIDRFIYPDFNDTSINFENLSLSISLGLDGQSLAVSTNLPKLNLLNKNYRVNLSDLDLNITLPDTKLSNLALSILIPDFLYTNFDDVVIDMDNVDVSHDPIISSSVNVIIRMDGMDATGLNSFDELFPMLSINSVNFKTPINESDSLITLTGLMSLLDITKMDLTTIGALLSSGFDLDTYMRNMPDYYKGSLGGDNVEISGAAVSESSGFNLGSLFENCDYSGLDAIKLDLTGLLESAGIDLADFGIDESEYDLSAISLSDMISAVSNSEFIKTAYTTISKLTKIDFDNLDMSGLVSSFDTDKLDLSNLLGSLNISGSDISGIIDMFSNLGSVFENCDLSCLGAIELDLTKLIYSLGIDISELDIDLSDYDLSAISLTELIGILNNLNLDMDTIKTLLKLIGVNIDDLDLNGLISSFDAENFDMTSLLESLNLSNSDIAGIIDMLTNSDVDFAGIFENCDYSCLGAIELDLTKLIYSLGIDISELDIDLSDYDLSAISLAELIGLLSNINLDMDTITSALKLIGIDLDNLDLNSLISSFDTENFDITSLLESLNLSNSDIAGIIDMLTNSDVDFAGIFENCDYSCLGAIELDLTKLIYSLGIDISELDIDLSDYDLSAISLAELIGLISNFEFDMDTINVMLKLFGFDLNDLDLDSLINSFDAENFDMTSLLESLNLSGSDISGIIDMFTKSDVDFESMFENCDYSSLDGMVLDLTGLIDSAGIDVSDLGIDMSDYDLSAISLPEIIDLLSNPDLDMSAITSNLESVDNLDLNGLINSFDAENFDMTSLLESLNLSDLNIAGIIDMFSNSDVDFAGIFENCDYSCLGAIELDLSNLIYTLGIDISELDIDLSDYDLTALSLSDLIGILNNLNLDMNTVSTISKLFGVNLDDLDLDGLISSFDVENFDITSLLESLNLSSSDISGIIGMFTKSDVDFAGIFKNCDYSCLGAIELDLSNLIYTLGIDISELDIDLSDYDLTALSLSELIGLLSNINLDMNTITSALKLIGIDLDGLDLNGLISSFDTENFDITSLLESLNLSNSDIAGIIDMLTNSDVDFAGIFKNFDYSSLGAIELDLTNLIYTLGIDLSELGIDLSDIDPSAVSLTELIGLLSNINLDMNTITTVIKLLGIDLDGLDLNGLISSFDTENFDITSLLQSLNLTDLDIGGIMDMFTNSDVDFESIFENFDYSSLGAIELDLSGLLDSAGIDLSDFGIDASDYDLSAINIEELIDMLSNSEFVMTIDTAISKVFNIDFDNLDTSGLVSSFDAENFDISSLLESLNLSTFDISGIFGNFDASGFDLSEFLNSSISMLIEKSFPEAAQYGDTE